MSPRVSVLIPTWNRANLIGAAIESALHQTYQDFEVIVVDDGSEDGTADVVKRYDRVRYVPQAHRGIPVTRNRALEEASGELLCWLDSDDMWAPEKLEKQVAYLDMHPECQIVFCRYRNFSDSPDGGAQFQRNDLNRADEKPDLACLATACLRRTLIEKWGGYIEKYAYAEDTEWLMRVSAGGVDLGHCLEEELYWRRLHSGQITLSHDPVSGYAYFRLVSDAIRRAKERGSK